MNSRRKFLRNSGITASALVAAKPFQLFAKTVSPFYKAAHYNNRITVFHTGHSSAEHFSTGAAAAVSLRDLSENILLLNTPHSGDNNTGELIKTPRLIWNAGYDAVLADAPQNTLLLADAVPAVWAGGAREIEPVRVFNKAGIKIGVLGITPAAWVGNAAGAFNEMNRLAKMLREENGCDLVICMSSLGYKTDPRLNDRRLAESTAHIDLIISGNNPGRLHPTILHNSLGHEVLLNNAGDPRHGISKTEIRFDASLKKNHVDFGAVTA